MTPGIVIVGGGQAGLEAAAALRTLGYDGTVTLICEEAHAPYQRPPLSKDFLIGKQEADSVFLRALAYYEKHGVDLILGDRVAEINRGARLVHLAAGGSLPYEQLILAVGARNRPLPVPGAENVLYLRSLDEAVTLRQRLAEARHGVVVIGGGFIGLEVAAAGRGAGKSVTVIEAAPRLMARAVSPLLSDFFLDVHRGQGVDVVLNTAVEEVLADAVIVSGGRRMEADLVVAGIGVVPNVELARDGRARCERRHHGGRISAHQRSGHFCHRRLRASSERLRRRTRAAGVGAERGRSGQVRGARDHGQSGALSRCSLVLDGSV